jgi:hypothetical protein
VLKVPPPPQELLDQEQGSSPPVGSVALRSSTTEWSSRVISSAGVGEGAPTVVPTDSVDTGRTPDGVGGGALAASPPVSNVGGVGKDEEGGGAEVETGLTASVIRPGDKRASSNSSWSVVGVPVAEDTGKEPPAEKSPQVR